MRLGILNYFESLLPSFKKKDMLTDTHMLFNDINETLLPRYLTVKKQKLTGGIYKNSESNFKRKINDYSSSPEETILKIIKMILDKNQDEIIATINKEFGTDSIKAGYDYYQLNIIKYVEGINFFNEYARKWNTAVMYQTVYEKYPYLNITTPDIKADIEFIEKSDNVESFYIICNMLSMSFKKYLDSIKELKGKLYQSSDWLGSNITLETKVDKYKSNMLPVQWNLVYHIGLAINSWRLEKHKSNKEELARYQLMLAVLHDDKEIEEDNVRKAQIEKQINYYSNEVNKLNAKIRVMEEG